MNDKRDKAYEKIQKELDIPITEIKNKIIGLRSQHSREVAKTNQKKSGQGVSENYIKTNWIYWDRLQFLIPVLVLIKHVLRCFMPLGHFVKHRHVLT